MNRLRGKLRRINLGNTYNNMTIVYRTVGKLDLALEYYVKALKISVTAVVEKYTSLGGAYCSMGVLHENHGEYLKALCCYE